MLDPLHEGIHCGYWDSLIIPGSPRSSQLRNAFPDELCAQGALWTDFEDVRALFGHCVWSLAQHSEYKRRENGQQETTNNNQKQQQQQRCRKPTSTNQTTHPTYPLEKFNSTLLNYQGKMKTLRTQDIRLGASSIIQIARIKIPAPDKVSTHLIRRFDTDAISASSFFKSAFPNATEEEESTQMNYLNQIYDTRAAGAVDLGAEHKLTGVWVPIEHASELAEEYGLTRFVAPLIAYPNPNVNKHSSSPLLGTTNKKNNHENEGITAPLSFGNTSPSNFSLSSQAKPSSPSAESKISNDTHHESKANQRDTYSSRSHKHSPSKTSTTVESSSDQIEHDETSSTHESVQQSTQESTHRLIGSDEVAHRAKQEALKLVNQLKSDSNVQSASAETPTSNDHSITENDKKKKSPSKNEKLNRKRSVEEVSPEDEEEGSALDEESDQDTTSRSFFPRLPWNRRSHQANHSKKTKRTKSFVQLPTTNVDDPLLSPLNPNKRNLAIAGIVIAGAAASIAPYFF
ncbi:hypothetical protein PSTT_03892 [Puccinia striiformis]|uniref:HTH APSES-type domain-containing protein n=1 Tax=Puccinia striiformis TaxID=27350 RepID=A0A2S4VUF3_9BASI|nr:hypothetical protein PSTT_03892 [Puccinia striiformis]